jgi:uncharacterized NAD(P)/FAD-binding protein YdhS
MKYIHCLWSDRLVYCQATDYLFTYYLELLVFYTYRNRSKLMVVNEQKKRIAILGAGPSGLFFYKHLVESKRSDWEVHLFDRSSQLGAGMPYGSAGANREHVTNVSANEIPPLVTSLTEWIQRQPAEVLEPFQLDATQVSDYRVVPRLLFGQYLAAQFDLLREQAACQGLVTHVHLDSQILDIVDDPETNQVWVETDTMGKMPFDVAIICTGHQWPTKHEGKIPLYFSSPYPPAKLRLTLNHAVAIRGASLTAIDAIRTLARHNGYFDTDPDGRLRFQLSPQSPDFRLVMHSREGLLPAIRFHLEEPLISADDLLSPDLVAANRAQNDGFLSLDFVFDQAFKRAIRRKDPVFYERIKAMSLEEFVETMMSQREKEDAFQLFAAEYRQAEESIKKHESIYWKEMLAVLSFAMNYPAKYFSAEDMERLKKVLMPLISLVIAFVPQSSARELLALHQAGLLTIQSVGQDSEVIPQPSGGAIYEYTDEDGQSHRVYYPAFVDCIGQPHLDFDDFPFTSLRIDKTVSPARLRYQSNQEGQAAREQGNDDVEQLSDGNYYLRVPGVAINDDFQLVDEEGKGNPRLYMMAVAHMGGYNPDYSGLDFCETASTRISQRLFTDNPTTAGLLLKY